MSVDRHRDLIRLEAAKRIIDDADRGVIVPMPGAVCRVDGCAADTVLGTLTGGAPMLCEGFPLGGKPCIARWLTETDIGSYEAWADGL